MSGGGGGHGLEAVGVFKISKGAIYVKIFFTKIILGFNYVG
jgi:hypothetical protein